jgi:hypothetical protein
MQNMGINQLANMYMGNPQPLAAKVQQAQQQTKPGQIPPDLEQAIALQKIQEMRQAAQNQQAMQAGGQQPTIMDKLRQMAQPQMQAQPQGMQMAPQGLPQGMSQGMPQQEEMPVQAAHGGSIAHLMSNLGNHYDGGGIVAFEEGGDVEKKRKAALAELALTMPEQMPEDRNVSVSAYQQARKNTLDEIKRLYPEMVSAPSQAAYQSVYGRQVANPVAPSESSSSAPSGPVDNPLKDYLSSTPAAPSPQALALLAEQQKQKQIQQAAARPNRQRPVAPATPPQAAVNQPAVAEAPSAVEDYLRKRFAVNPEERGAAAEAKANAAYGAPNTEGYDRAVEELNRRKAQFEAPATGIPALMEYLRQIAQAPRGVGSFTAGAMGAQKVNDLQKERETNQFELVKQILDQEQKKAEVVRGYKKELYGINTAAVANAGTEAYNAALALHKSEDEAKQLKQQAEQKELDRQNNIEQEKMRQAGANARHTVPLENQLFPSFLAANGNDPVKALEAMKSAGAGNRGQLTYDQASDNVDKWMQSTVGSTEISRMRKEAKDAGRPLPSAMEIRNQLIKDAMTASGSSYAGKMNSAAGPSSGKMPPPPKGFKPD